MNTDIKKHESVQTNYARLPYLLDPLIYLIPDHLAHYFLNKSRHLDSIN